MRKKPKIAIFSLTSCEGCQFALFNLGEKFFNFLRKVELAQCSLLEEESLKCDLFDIAFIEGNPITKDDFKILKEAREKAKILVALGNCAALGGIPEMKNYQNKEKTIRIIYKHVDNIANPEIKEIEETKERAELISNSLWIALTISILAITIILIIHKRK